MRQEEVKTRKQSKANKSKEGHYDTKALTVPKIHLLTRFMPSRGWNPLIWNIPITFSLLLLTWWTLQLKKHLKMTIIATDFLHLGLPLIFIQQFSPPARFPPCRRIYLPISIHMCKMKNRPPHSEIIHHSNCEAFIWVLLLLSLWWAQCFHVIASCKLPEALRKSSGNNPPKPCRLTNCHSRVFSVSAFV